MSSKTNNPQTKGTDAPPPTRNVGAMTTGLIQPDPSRPLKNVPLGDLVNQVLAAKEQVGLMLNDTADMMVQTKRTMREKIVPQCEEIIAKFHDAETGEHDRRSVNRPADKPTIEEFFDDKFGWKYSTVRSWIKRERDHKNKLTNEADDRGKALKFLTDGVYDLPETVGGEPDVTPEDKAQAAEEDRLAEEQQQMKKKEATDQRLTAAAMNNIAHELGVRIPDGTKDGALPKEVREEVKKKVAKLLKPVVPAEEAEINKKMEVLVGKIAGLNPTLIAPNVAVSKSLSRLLVDMRELAVHLAFKKGIAVKEIPLKGHKTDAEKTMQADEKTGNAPAKVMVCKVEDANGYALFEETEVAPFTVTKAISSVYVTVREAEESREKVTSKRNAKRNGEAKQAEGASA